MISEGRKGGSSVFFEGRELRDPTVFCEGRMDCSSRVL